MLMLMLAIMLILMFTIMGAFTFKRMLKLKLMIMLMITFSIPLLVSLRVPRLRPLNPHVLAVWPASAGKICTSSRRASPPLATLPPTKSAFPHRVARFRLLYLHLLSMCLASAC